MSKCEQVLVEGHDMIPICLIEDSSYALLTFIMQEYPGGPDRKICWLQIIKCQNYHYH